MADSIITELNINRKGIRVAHSCSHCSAVIMRPPSHFSHGVHGPLAGLVFCNRECQKRMFRGIVRCCWPGCPTERMVEGGNFKRKQHKAYFCDAHTAEMEAATGFRIVTQKRLDWLADKPIGHRHVTAIFYRWSVFKLGGEKCADCSDPLTLGPLCNIDHVIPVSEGGKTQISNMQPLCIECHRRKSAAEQKIVNLRRWSGRGPHNRHMTHVEKDLLIERLRARLQSLNAPTD